MHFQVPQFIEVEDKIFGPLTFKQFVYIAGGAGLCFIEWVYLPAKFIAVLFIIPTATFALALAFYKVNSRPFILILEAAFRYLLNNKLFLWTKQPRKKGKAEEAAVPPEAQRALIIPKLSESRLKELAWSLDIKETLR
jgi:hypothetical protein